MNIFASTQDPVEHKLSKNMVHQVEVKLDWFQYDRYCRMKRVTIHSCDEYLITTWNSGMYN